MEELRAGNTAAILELKTDSGDQAHRRCSLYALMADSSREGEGCLRRVVQREEVAFYPKTDIGGALLHPHVHHPIVPGVFDQHIRRAEGGVGPTPRSIAEEQRALDRCLDALVPSMASSTPPTSPIPTGRRQRRSFSGRRQAESLTHHVPTILRQLAHVLLAPLFAVLHCLRAARPAVCAASSLSLISTSANLSPQTQQSEQKISEQ